jgi:hypothetical protein
MARPSLQVLIGEMDGWDVLFADGKLCFDE